MRKKLILIMIVWLLSFFLFSYNYEKEFNRQISSKGTEKLLIKNVNGRIIVNAQKGNKISIFATIKTNSKEKLELTKIKVIKFSNYIEVKPDFPHRRNSNISVDFLIKVPECLFLNVKSVNGRVLVDANLKGVYLTTVNGKILVSSKSIKGKLTTVNGGIKVHAEKIAGELSLKTVNGSIALYVSYPDNIRLKASTVNGSVKIEHEKLRITYKKRLFPFYSFSTIKAAGENPHYSVILSTVNGSIKVLPN